MATEGIHGASTPAPPGGVDYDGCQDPTDEFVALQCFYANDVVVGERRKVALDDMKTRVAAVSGIQVTYEDAIAAQKPALRQLLQDLKAIKKTVECQVTDRQDDLIRCFCEKIEKEPGDSSPLAIPDDPCPKVDELTSDDLEELRTTQTKITSAIDEHKRALDELTGLPAGMKATFNELAAKVKDLNTRIGAKTIDDERAFVMQLHYRRAYIELRHQLTDPRTYVCRIYDLLDELFALCEWDACVAGAIAWLEKAKQLEDERKQGKDAEGAFIDDVLRCSKPKESQKPPDDDTEDLDELDPCRGVKQGKPDPGPRQTEPDPYGGGGGKVEPPPTRQYPPTGEAPPTEQHPPTEQAVPRGENEPPYAGPTTTQS
jgi:hypothetical protein